MAIAWFVCPYDTVPRGAGVARRCAMCRHIPRIPNADNAVWDEAEILGNHTIVKVRAPDAVIATIAADPDFRQLPHDQVTIDGSFRTAIRNRLVALGYTTQEINDTNWNRRALFDLLTNAVSDVVPNATQTGFVWTSARRAASKLVSNIESRLGDS